MSRFLDSISAEVERLRASEDAVAPLLTLFRKHPMSEWSTLYAKLGVALDKEMKEEATVAARQSRVVVPAKSNGASAKANGSARKSRPAPAEPEEPEEGSKTAAAADLFKQNGDGFTANELGRQLYGNDARGHHKARAVVHHLQTKWKMPIKRDALSGRWVLAESEGR